MSKQLYEEALADVKKLKEVAEDNAKRALLEAVTPRIKDLIENQLLGEAEKDVDGKLLLDDELEGAQMQMPPGADTGSYDDQGISSFPGEGSLSSDQEFQDNLAGDEFNVSALRVPGEKDVYELNAESARALGLLVNESNSQFDKKLKSLVRQVQNLSSASKIIKESTGFNEVVSTLVESVETMYAHVQEKMDSLSKKSSYETILEQQYSTLKQLMERKMNRKNKRLSEADVTLKLTGLPDDVNLDDVGVDLITGEEGGEEGGDEELDLGGDDESGGEEGGDEELDLGGDEESGGEEGKEGGDEELDLDLGDEEGEEEEKKEGQMESRRFNNNLVVEIDEGMLRREIARMKSLREEKLPSVKGHGPGKVADGFEDDDLGDPFVDIDLREQDEPSMDEAEEQGDLDEQDDNLDEMDGLDEYDLDEDDTKKAQKGSQGSEDEEEQSENDMLEITEDDADLDQAEKRRAHPGHDEDTMQPNVQKDMPVESIKRHLAKEARIQSEAKQKAQKAQKGKKAAAKKKGQAARTQAARCDEAYKFYAKKFNESVARSRRLKGMLSEAVRRGRTLNGAPARSAAETQNLRNKLAETNLFNAKLLFANKVLQNESFTRAQKANVIERLDEARSQRELKLVYESLIGALNNNARRPVNESHERAVIGSSSRPTRSASSQTLNEGFETDRWARLAGISK